MQKSKLSSNALGRLTFTAAVVSLASFVSYPYTALAADCKNNTPTELQKCLQANPIVEDLNKIVGFLSAVAGIAIIATIIIGGIQYSMAGGNAQEITKAKQRIINALIAFVFFLFAVAIVNWLIPGGIFE
jgi:hypothetical protein